MIYEYGLFNEFKIISEIQYERFKDDLIYLENDEVYLLNVNKYNFINKVSCYVVNATFACEIALKGLLRLNQNIIHIYDQKVMKSHRLDDLFDFLLVEQQEFILKELPLLTTIEDLKQESAYKKAKELLDAGFFKDAKSLLSKIEKYKDSAEILSNIDNSRFINLLTFKFML